MDTILTMENHKDIIAIAERNGYTTPIIFMRMSVDPEYIEVKAPLRVRGLASGVTQNKEQFEADLKERLNRNILVS